ncbi:hypothetical protein TCON_0698 [Astathelohania contejeani]|uniref:Sulfate transporter n=1 Tax=Astathelohania contejeani TaxID=164912 RepID=A0ABQ7I167_9MICR|nr:hypothetical protein TCON_0698 [Thelohania contejeani]
MDNEKFLNNSNVDETGKNEKEKHADSSSSEHKVSSDNIITDQQNENCSEFSFSDESNLSDKNNASTEISDIQNAQEYEISEEENNDQDEKSNGSSEHIDNEDEEKIDIHNSNDIDNENEDESNPKDIDAISDDTMMKITDSIAKNEIIIPEQRSTNYESERKKSVTPLKRILNVIISNGLFIIIIMLMTMSYGSNMFLKMEGHDLRGVGMALYLYATIASQLIFSVSTNFKAGVVAIVASEILPLINEIQKASMDIVGNDVNAVVTNTIFSMFIAIFLYSIIIFLLGTFGGSILLKSFPRPAMFGVLGCIGMRQIQASLDMVIASESNIIRLILLFCIIIGIFLIQYFCRKKKLVIIPIFILSCTIWIQLALRFIFKKSGNDLIAEKWIESAISDNLSPMLILQYIDISKLNWKIVNSCKFNILTVTLLCIISSALNLPAYFWEMNMHTQMPRAIISQSLSNTLTSLIGMPTQLYSSYSAIFNYCGGVGKLESISLGILLILISYFGKLLKHYIPIIILAAIPMIHGSTFIVNSLYQPFRSINRLEYLIIASTLLVSDMFGYIWGFLYGLLTCSSVMLIDYSAENEMLSRTKENIKQDRKTYLEPLEDEGIIQVIDIDYILFYGSLDRFFKSASNLDIKKIIVFDFCLCFSIDLAANAAIRQLFNILHKDGYKIMCIGKPKNFMALYLDKSFASRFKMIDGYHTLHDDISCLRI